MAIDLEIRDGSPQWWLSPDIWVVPGADPNGSPGTPIAGQSAFVWAHVANNGTNAAMGARIDFWWADPSTQVLRSNAHFIGSSFVDLVPGASEDVLCLTPWQVTLVNGGHECVVATATAAGAPAPPDAFDPPNHPEVAQLNLSVAVASMMAAPICISAGRRSDKAVRIVLRTGGKIDRDQLARLGLSGFKAAAGRIEVGLSPVPIPCGKDGRQVKSQEKLDLRLVRGTRAAVYLDLREAKVRPGEYALVHVVETAGDRVLGGCSFAVITDKEKKGAAR